MIYFLVYLFLEILFSYEFTSMFTPFGMFLEILFTFFFGVFLLKNLNIAFIDNIQKLRRREISQEEFVSIGVFQLVGAILLMIPGVFTDILGILMQFDSFGSFVARSFLPKKEVKKDFDDDIIDVEIIEQK